MTTHTAQTKYFEGIGRRKEAIARVRLHRGVKKYSFIVNGKDGKAYFKIMRYEKGAMAPLQVLGEKDVQVEARVYGGGVMAQSEAVKLGLGRAILKASPELKMQLRNAGCLTRDARAVERKKYGKKKARRSTQWRKR